LVSVIEVLQSPIFEILVILAAFGIGLPQGYILGKALIKRFARLQNHAKVVSVSLFFLFLANAIISVPRFASPEKIILADVFEATSRGEIASVLFTVFGVNTGFLAVLAFSVTIITLILLRLTHLKGPSKAFIVFVSLAILSVTVFSRFTDYTPTTFEAFLYFLYQLGITIGIVFGSAKKIKPTIDQKPKSNPSDS
jgi:hypothetical protein